MITFMIDGEVCDLVRYEPDDGCGTFIPDVGLCCDSECLANGTFSYVFMDLSGVEFTRHASDIKLDVSVGGKKIDL